MRSSQRLNFGAPGSTLPSAHNPMEPTEALPDKVAQAIRDIRKEAAGRTCGGCRHIRNGWCAEHRNHNGANLSVIRYNAVACAQHTQEIQ